MFFNPYFPNSFKFQQEEHLASKVETKQHGTITFEIQGTNPYVRFKFILRSHKSGKEKKKKNQS